MPLGVGLSVEDIDQILKIIADPVTQFAPFGDTVIFSVVATGITPLNYIWFKDDIDMPAEQSPTLEIVDAQVPDLGEYHCVVYNTFGSVASSKASLFLGDPPSFSLQPSIEVVGVDQPANFTAIAAGTPPYSYQWFKDTLEIPGENLSTLDIANAQPSDEGDYFCRLSSPYGEVDSVTVGLSVIPLPTITFQPVGKSSYEGDNHLLTVGAIGEGDGILYYQWERLGVPLGGEILSILDLSPLVPENVIYACKVTNNYGGEIYSASASMYVIGLLVNLTLDEEGVTWIDLLWDADDFSLANRVTIQVADDVGFTSIIHTEILNGVGLVSGRADPLPAGIDVWLRARYERVDKGIIPPGWSNVVTASTGDAQAEQKIIDILADGGYIEDQDRLRDIIIDLKAVTGDVYNNKCVAFYAMESLRKDGAMKVNRIYDLSQNDRHLDQTIGPDQQLYVPAVIDGRGAVMFDRTLQGYISLPITGAISQPYYVIMVFVSDLTFQVTTFMLDDLGGSNVRGFLNFSNTRHNMSAGTSLYQTRTMSVPGAFMYKFNGASSRLTEIKVPDINIDGNAGAIGLPNNFIITLGENQVGNRVLNGWVAMFGIFTDIAGTAPNEIALILKNYFPTIT